MTSAADCCISLSSVLTDAEAVADLHRIGHTFTLAQRFSNAVPLFRLPLCPPFDFLAVTIEEIENRLKVLPSTATGPDKVTASVIMLLGSLHPEELLSMVNSSLETTWLHPQRKS